VGHGNLAERALVPCIPNGWWLIVCWKMLSLINSDCTIDFPYTIRAESLITESCGSSRCDRV
jgi:polyribonucleotide nucleotidyltransferase